MTNLTLEFTPMMTALKTLKKAQDARIGIPIMRHVAITSDAHGRAVLTASDLDNWLSITVDGSTCDGDFTVDRAELEKTLTGGNKGKLVKMSVNHGTDRDGVVTVTHDDLTVDLEILPISDFPEAPLVKDVKRVDMSCGMAREMLTYCAGSMSAEETRYYLRGTYLHQFGTDSGKLAAVATDGHRLNLAETATCYDGTGVIMRDDAVKLTIAMIGKSEGDVSFQLPQNGNVIKVEGDRWHLVTRKVDGTFPDYTRVIPREPKGKGTLSCDAVSKAAARVSRITSKQGAAILDIEAGMLRHNGNGTGVKGLAIDLGDMFPSGDLCQVGLNSTYLTAAMQQIGMFSETCTVKLTDAGTPIRIHPRSLPSWAENITSVVMPMRVA